MPVYIGVDQRKVPDLQNQVNLSDSELMTVGDDGYNNQHDLLVDPLLTLNYVLVMRSWDTPYISTHLPSLVAHPREPPNHALHSLEPLHPPILEPRALRATTRPDLARPVFSSHRLLLTSAS